MNEIYKPEGGRIDTVENTVQRYIPATPSTTMADVTTAAPPTTTAPTFVNSTLQSTVKTYLPWAAAGGLALLCVALIILLILNRRDPINKNAPAPRH